MLCSAGEASSLNECGYLTLVTCKSVKPRFRTSVQKQLDTRLLTIDPEMAFAVARLLFGVREWQWLPSRVYSYTVTAGAFILNSTRLERCDL